MNGQRRLASLAAIAVVAAMASNAAAQTITVNVNGQPVAFPGVGAQSVNGRVMVPLRGVMERLGAYVSYSPATKTVTANKGGVDLQLAIGQRQATVNGRTVMLDVPAQEYRGSTLVPLRFMGEALGAEVRWDAPSMTVNIVAGGSAAQPMDPNNYTPPSTTPTTPATTNPANVQVTSFTSNGEGFLRAGSTVQFTLEGTPGGNATLQIPGVSQEIPMREVSAGRYVADLAVPNNPAQPITVSKANAVARLRFGNAERLIQAGNPIAIDTQAPTFREMTPSESGRITRARPNISATFDDATGSGIVQESVKMTLDGRDVTQEANVTGSFISYRPAQRLEPGRHEVVLTARDRAGNVATKSWAFTLGANEDIIKSFTHNAEGTIEPGQVLNFTLVGEAGGTATASIGNKALDIPLREVEPGRYVGEYTVRRGDNFQNENVTARLRAKSGEIFTSESATKLAVQAGPPEAPRITSPTEDVRVGNSLVIKGTAAKRARVRVRVDYRKAVLGAFALNGTITEQIVEADENGNFTTPAIPLSGLAGGSGTTYTITATALGANDVESEVTGLTLKR
jgi:hypothetical protein